MSENPDHIILPSMSPEEKMKRYRLANPSPPKTTRPVDNQVTLTNDQLKKLATLPVYARMTYYRELQVEQAAAAKKAEQARQEREARQQQQTPE